jgi:hypothetical protein
VRLLGSALAAPCVCGALFAGLILASAAPAAASQRPRISVSPNPSAPGTTTTFEVLCGANTNSATLFGTAIGLSKQIPMHHVQAPTFGEFRVTVTLPVNIGPGTRRPSIDCSNGFSGFAVVRVRPIPGQGALTGDGTTSTQTGTPLTEIGVGAIAIGVVVGAAALFLRPRAGSSR